MNSTKRNISSLLLALGVAIMTLTLTSACSAPSGLVRLQQANELAASHGWRSQKIPAGLFTLVAFTPARPQPTETLTIYFEGDGLAWLSRARASSDPTPSDPVGLKLALRHPSRAAAYLARPCQYLEADEIGGCDQHYWTLRRFAPQVITSSNLAIDTLKRQFGAQRLVLVGYSGGGAVAALVAARRTDVAMLVTVAGNLDHRYWTDQHHVCPLIGSLNPADEWLSLTRIPQLHWVGSKDDVVGPEVAYSYRARFPEGLRPEVRIMEGFDHVCCWSDQWPGKMLPPSPTPWQTSQQWSHWRQLLARQPSTASSSITTSQLPQCE